MSSVYCEHRASSYGPKTNTEQAALQISAKAFFPSFFVYYLALYLPHASPLHHHHQQLRTSTSNPSIYIKVCGRKNLFFMILATFY